MYKLNFRIMDSDDDYLYEATDSGNEEGEESDEQVGVEGDVSAAVADTVTVAH